MLSFRHIVLCNAARLRYTKTIASMRPVITDSTYFCTGCLLHLLKGWIYRPRPQGLGFFCGAPGRAHLLGGESPLRTRQGEPLAERQGCRGRLRIWRKPKAKRWPDEQEADTRRRCGVSSPILDRLIQQALLQVLQPQFEPEFSEHSYGFRPGRNAWQAVQRAQSYIGEGRRWVVDLDLEKFFDRVNHDILMSRVARRVKDERILKLIRRYLRAGMMSEGIVSARDKGTPQGGPLSPLLSNILLTDLDRELERRGHRFCRYADDCNIYVKSEAAGQHAMAAITCYLENKLKLQVNQDKSAVAPPWQRKFLGYSVTRHKQPRLKIADSSLKRFKDRVREIVVGSASRNLGKTIEAINPVLRGWTSYFRLTEVKGVLQELDGWIRRDR